jgi:signal recognition particle subunit SRP54
MVFDKLKEGLQAAMTGLRKAVVLDKKTVREYTKEIQKTLLSADVNVKLVFDLSKNIEERGFLEKAPGMLDKRENLIKITYEELVKLIGKGEKLPIEEGEKILLVGTQGSGKTTTAAKLASYFLRRGLHPRLICADTFRPAAYDQLKQLSEDIRIPFYGEPAEKDALKIIEAALSKFGVGGPTIIDSEGRHSLDEDLMRDINRIYNEVKPDKTLLVLDSTVEQRAGEQAAAFKKACNVDGVILTKLDGSAKGGGALSACASTNAPVYFIGVGEHIEDFEEFEPDRFVSRIIGFGDLQGLLEKAKEVEFDEESTSRLMSGKFTLDDLYQQIEQIQKMGSISKLMDMLPFGAKVPKGTMDVQEEKLTVYKVIIDSMTDDEKQNPEEIKKARLERISRGSGRKPEEVRDLLNYHKKMKSMMKNLGDERKLRRFMKRFGTGA